MEIEGERRAQEKLRYKIEVEWPNWYKRYVEPNIMRNVFAFLTGPWSVTCNKCRSSFSIELTETGIANLLRNGYMDIECQNPNCVDTLLFATGRHKKDASLKT